MSTADEPEPDGWDDWRRPANAWPLLLLAVAPPLALAALVFVVLRALGVPTP
jgi:hypothetical protein